MMKRMILKRKRGIWVGIAAALSLMWAVPVSASDVPIWDQYVQAEPDGIEPAVGAEPELPNFSFAGYQYFASPLPEPSTVTDVIYDVTNYGAVPNDGNSDQAAIQSAIDAAELGSSADTSGTQRYIVFFPPGQYLINTDNDLGTTPALTVQGSRITLRGSGRGNGGTELFEVNHLRPTDTSVLYATPPMLEVGTAGGTTPVTTLAADVQRETFWITVTNAGSLAVGQDIQLHLQSSDPAVKARYLGGYTAPAEWNGNFVSREMHQIAAIDGNNVKLTEPVHLDMFAADGWTVESVHMDSELGVENIKFRGNWHDTFVHHQDYINDSGWFLLQLDHVKNGWVRNCDFVDFNQGFNLLSSRAVTALDIDLYGNPGHFGAMVQQTYGGFVGNVHEAAHSWHGPSLSGYTAGTVFWRSSYSADSSFDTHASYPYASLYDNVQGGVMRGRAGGGKPHLPNHLEKAVFWNFKNIGQPVTNWTFWTNTWDSWVKPIVVGNYGYVWNIDDTTTEAHQSPGTQATPDSLFESQLGLRLGSVPSWLLDHYPVTPQEGVRYLITEDAYVYSGNPDHPFPSTKDMIVKGHTNPSLNRMAYLKSDLSAITDSKVASAQLSFYVETSTGYPVTLTVTGLADHNWSEATIDWNNQPSMTGAQTIGTVTVTKPGWYTIDASSYVNSQLSAHAASFQISDPSLAGKDVKIFSSENNDDNPFLTIKPVKTKYAFSEDAYGDGTNPTTNYGGAGHLVVKNNLKASGSRISYLKNDFSDFASSSADSVTLHVYVDNALVATPITVVGFTDTSWNENTLTYNNQPIITGAVTLGTINVTGVGWYSMDVTSFVNSQMSGSKAVSFQLSDTSGSKNYISFASSNSDNKPYLQIVKN